MKKIFKILALVLLVIILAAGGWFLYLCYGPKTPIADVLPSGALAYVRLAKAGEHWQAATHSEFWKNISAIDLPKVLARNKVPQKNIDELKGQQAQLEGFFKSPLTQKFLGKEIALAVYGSKDSYSIMMVLRLAPSVQAAELLTHFSSQWGEGITTSEETYAGERIVHVHLKDNKASFKYVKLNDLLVVAEDNDGYLNAVIDVDRRKHASLNKDEGFVFVQAHAYAGADGLLYVNVQGLNAMLRREEWMQEDLLSQTAGFKTYALSFLPGTITKYKFIVGLEPKAVRPALRRLVECSPKVNGSLSFVPSHVAGYQWGGCYDLVGSWQQFREQVYALPDAGKQVQKIKGGIERRTGLNISADILPVLGQEAGGYFTDVDTLGLFPYPRFLAFVKVNDRVRAEEIFKKIVKVPFGLVQEEAYNKSNIRYLALPLGSNMDPGYTFVGDYLLAASSRQLLKKSIDVSQDPSRSLKTDKTFSALGLEDAAGTQSIAFLKVGEFARSMQGLLNWGNKYLSAQVNMAGAYKQEGDGKKKELEEAIKAAQTELDLALVKLVELKSKPSKDLQPEEQEFMAGAVLNLEENVQGLRDDIKTYKAQQLDVDNVIAEQQAGVERAKLFMFNSQHVLVPFLNGLQSVNAQGTKVMLSDKAIETELMFN